MTLKLRPNHLNLTIILLVSLFLGRYLLLPGFYTFSDESHLANLHQMSQAIISGQIPPRWAPNFSYNFGYPLYNFYYLLPYYLGSFFHLGLGLSLIWSLKIVFLFAFVFSGFFMYYLAQKFFSPLISLSVSLIYLATPYRAVDLYVRGAVGEMLAFTFMPLVLLTFLNLITKPTKKTFFFAATSLALLILSHNLTFVLFLPLLLCLTLSFIFFYIPKTNRISTIKHLCMAIFTALLLTSFYLLPAAIEKRFIQSGTPFNPLDHFPFIKQLLVPYWGYGASVWGPTDMLSFNIGITNLIGSIIAIIGLLFTKSKYKYLTISFFFCLIITIFLMNIRSYPIWQIIPLATYIQFPWRLLLITTFLTPLIIGFISHLSPNSLLAKIPLLLALLAVISTVNYFHPHTILPVTDDYFLNRFFINQTSSGTSTTQSTDYKNTSEDYLPPTIWNKIRPTSLPPKVEPSPDYLIKNITYHSTVNYSLTIDVFTPSILKINNYYFPGWNATIDGQKTTVFPSGDYGLTAINLPQGSHQLTISFSETPLRQTADYISLITLLTLLCFTLLPRHHDPSK